MLNNQSIKETGTDVTPDDLFDWRGQIRKLESSWHSLDLPQLWHLRRADFYNRVKHLNESTNSDALFDAAESDAKRQQLISYIEQSFISRMQQNLRRSLWDRVFRKQPTNIEDLRNCYEHRGKSREFDNEFTLLLNKTKEIEEKEVSRLYNQQERSSRLEPLISAERNQFLDSQEQDLQMHDRFSRLTRSLEEDELDIQLKKLSELYHFIGQIGRASCRERV